MRGISLAFFWVGCAGAAGGLINSVLNDGGLTMPESLIVDGKSVWVPGFLGKLLVGAFAAVLSFALYGPASAWRLIGEAPSEGEKPASPNVFLTAGAVAGALLVGFAGGKWIATEADNQLNRGTAIRATEIIQAQRMSPNRTVPADATKALEALREQRPLEAYRSINKKEP